MCRKTDHRMIWNDQMFELYGISQSGVPGTVEAWKQGLHPEDSSRAIQDCQTASNGERDFEHGIPAAAVLTDQPCTSEANGLPVSWWGPEILHA